MFNLKEYKNPQRLEDRLPWAVMPEPGLVVGKTGTLSRTIEYRGNDLYSATAEEITTQATQENHALRQLPGDWALFYEMQRRQAAPYRVTPTPYDALNAIEAERAAQFRQQNLANRYYITLVFQPPAERQTRLLSSLYDRSATESGDYLRHYETFETHIQRFVSNIARIYPLVRLLDADQTLTYLHSTISTKHHPVVTPENTCYLAHQLSDQPLSAGLTPKLGENYLGIIAIKGFPRATYPQMLYDLSRLPFELRWMTRFITLDKIQATKALAGYERKWLAKRKSIVQLVQEVLTKQATERYANQDAEAYADDCQSLGQLVTAGDVIAGLMTANVVVWDEDLTRLNEKKREIESSFAAQGFVTVDETYNGVQAWFSTIPGHVWSNVRRPILSSLHTTHLLPTAAVFTGRTWNEHFNAPPLFWARAEDGSAFKFNLHVGDVGHTFVVGPTGAGKSTLLSFIAQNFIKYDQSQIFIFDKDYSQLAVTRGLAGAHYNLAQDPITFQPLRQIDNAGERAWALEWLVHILEHENIKIQPDQKAEIWSCLNDLVANNERRELYTLTNLSALFQDRQLKSGLEPYTLQGAYGAMLDSVSEGLFVDRVQCFEMDYLMANLPQAVFPILLYLFRRIEQRLNGQPTLIILDEVWKFLSNPLFMAKIRDWLKTMRKKNAAVVFATQSIADMTETAISSTLIDNCPTTIYLPNPKAKNAEIGRQYQNFGLNERQIDIIAQAQAKRHYYVSSTYGNRLIDLDLGPVALAFCGSSDKADIRTIHEIKDDFANRWIALKLSDSGKIP